MKSVEPTDFFFIWIHFLNKVHIVIAIVVVYDR